MNDGLKFLIGAIIVFAGIVSAVVFGAEKQQEYACKSYGKITGREIQYVFLTGCFAKDKHGAFRYWGEFKDIK